MTFNTFALNRAAQVIEDAWRAGRTIVPIVGAGGSVDAGVPHLDAILTYIGSLHAYVRQNLFLPAPIAKEDEVLAACRRRYDNNVAQFVADFGWPDRFLLRQELVRGLPHLSVDHAILDSLTTLGRELAPVASESLFAKLREVAEPLLQSGAITDEQLHDVGTTLVRNVLIDWRRLIRHVTGHRSELIDSLFGRLHHARTPSGFHNYLAHLTRVMGIPVIFTFNFDRLIEIAMTSHGVIHQVFSMEYGAALPSRVLVDATAIVKMHGSTHNLLVDERVDYPLRPEYLTRFSELTGSDPLLVVIGSSGSERRLQDIITHVIGHRVKGSKGPAVLWAQFAPYREIPNVARRNDVEVCRYADAGLFLSGIYTTLTTRFPASLDRSPGNIARTFPSASIPITSSLYAADPSQVLQGKKTAIIDGTSYLKERRGSPVYPTVLRVLAAVRSRYSVIYIDLEEHHTLGGVVAAILDQARQSDSGLMPLRIPVSRDAGASSITIKAAVRRVREALRRNRTALILDGIDAFEWRATTHHGYTSSPNDNDLEQLLEFILNLLREHRQKGGADSDGSIICVTVDEPGTRHSDDDGVETALVTRANHISSESEELERRKELIKRKFGEIIEENKLQAPEPPDLRPPTHSTDTYSAMVGSVDSARRNDVCVWFLKVACTLRRSRSLVTLRLLWDDLGPLSDDRTDSDYFDGFLSDLIQQRIFYPLDGGSFSMDRPYRNSMYSNMTRDTSASVIAANLLGKIGREQGVSCVKQLTDCVFIHDWCAMHYFNACYLPTGDSFFFLEYVYHRVSGIRYITNLLLILSRSLRHDARRGATPFEYVHTCALHIDSQCNRFPGLYRIAERNLSTRGEAVIGVLAELRIRCIRGLANSWKRAEAALRETVVPDTLLSLCNTLLGYDLAKNLGLTSRVDHLRAIFPKISTIAGHLPKPEPEEELRMFESSVRLTQRKCLYERGDFRALFEVAIAVAVGRQDASQYNCRGVSAASTAESYVSQCLDRLNSIIAKGINPGDIDRCAALVDAFTAAYWYAYSSGVSLGEVSKSSSIAYRWTSLNEGAGEQLRRADPESYIRFLFYVCEFELSALSEIGAGIVGRLVTLRSSDMDAALARVESNIKTAIDLVQEERPGRGAEMHNLFMTGEGERSLLIAYKSLFHILRGRTRSARARLRRLGAVDLRLAGRVDTRGGLSAARTLRGKEEFAKAFREFEYARAGISSQNRALFTLCELFACETAIAQAQAEADCGMADVAAVSTKLRSAKAYLESARESLKSGGRHVLLWRLLALLSARHAVLCVRVAAVDIANRFRGTGTKQGERTEELEAESAREAGYVIQVVKDGLQAIRDGLDHAPEDAERFLAGLCELWAQLLFASLVFGSGIFVAYKREVDLPRLRSQALKVWFHLNASVDLPVNEEFCEEWVERGLETITKEELADVGGVFSARLGATIGERIKKLWENVKKKWCEAA